MNKLRHVLVCLLIVSALSGCATPPKEKYDLFSKEREQAEMDSKDDGWWNVLYYALLPLQFVSATK